MALMNGNNNVSLVPSPQPIDMADSRSANKRAEQVVQQLFLAQSTVTSMQWLRPSGITSITAPATTPMTPNSWCTFYDDN